MTDLTPIRPPARTHGKGTAAAVRPSSSDGGGTVVDLAARLDDRTRALVAAVLTLDTPAEATAADLEAAARTILAHSANPVQIARARGVLALIDGRGPRG